MAEKALWKWLKLYCPKGKYTRVENGEAGPGTPDVYYRLRANSGWIEMKDARHPNSLIPFRNEDVGLHKSQRDWIQEEVTLGGLVWIVARVGKQILFVHGKYCQAFNGARMTRLLRFSALTIDQNNPGPSVRRLKQLLEGDI